MARCSPHISTTCKAHGHLPLFYVSALGTPSGSIIIFMDAVPIVALAGSLIRKVTGAVPQLLVPVSSCVSLSRT
jgi:hypothetical protein